MFNTARQFTEADARNCFNRMCRFHLRNGQTIIGSVIDDSDGCFTIETIRDKNKEIFSKNLVYDYTIYGQRGWNIQQVRGQYFGRGQFGYNSIPVTKKLIIFGAGASYDLGKPESVAPLTDDIFGNEHALRCYQGAEKLRPELLTARRMGTSLEEFFDEKWEEIRRTGDRDLLACLINFQYFLQFQFRQISFDHANDTANNYHVILRLLKQLFEQNRGENFAIVTFNYDTLLENAIEHIFNWRYKSDFDYIFNGPPESGQLKPVLLFKPHGSWNWIHELPDSLAPKEEYRIHEMHHRPEAYYKHKVDYAQLKLAIDDRLLNTDLILDEIPSVALDRFKVVDYDYKFLQDYYPNLLIPYRKKDEFLMPNYHESAMFTKLKDIDEILVVGWKGTEDKFNSTLARIVDNKKVHVSYVSRSSKTVETELRKHNLNASYQHIPGGFSQYIEDVIHKKRSLFTI